MSKFKRNQDQDPHGDGTGNIEEELKKNELRRPMLLFQSSPLKTIFVLVLIILLLALLIFFFGLGSGGGKTLPGTGDSMGVKPQTVAGKSPTKELGKTSVRRELRISFVPSESAPEEAKPLLCNVQWTDPVSGGWETRQVAETNKPDFEFALEKIIRAWYNASPPKETDDVPIAAVVMTPFPGEGVLRKIEEIVRDVDIRISILRLEKEVR